MYIIETWNLFSSLISPLKKTRDVDAKKGPFIFICIVDVSLVYFFITIHFSAITRFIFKKLNMFFFPKISVLYHKLPFENCRCHLTLGYFCLYNTWSFLGIFGVISGLGFWYKTQPIPIQENQHPTHLWPIFSDPGLKCHIGGERKETAKTLFKLF